MAPPPSDRFDPAKTDLEKGVKSAEGVPSPSAQKSGGAWQAWLPLLVALVAMPLLAYGVTTWILVPKLQKSLGLAPVAAKAGEGETGEAKGAKDAPAANGRKENVPMSKLLVNVAGTMGSRYLLTSVTLVGSAPDFKGKIEKLDAQLRDAACGILSTKTIADLEKPGARNMVRSELISAFNSILGGATVQEIYFTEFAIQ